MHGKKALKYFSVISLNQRIKFIKLLFRWHGSVWKLLWADFIWFIVLYICVTLLYRLCLIRDPVQRRTFESIVSYMNKVGALVPVSFLLGFFVSTVLGRWWTIINAIPWLTKASFTSQAMISSGDLNTRHKIRATFVRYLNLAWILSLIQLSQKVKKRFFIVNPDPPKYKLCQKEPGRSVSIRERFEKMNEDEIVRKYFGKIINENEIQVFESFEKNATERYKAPYIVPLMWTVRLLRMAQKEGYIVSDSCFFKLYDVVGDIRNDLGSLGTFNLFNVPLVYTQVVIIVVYAFLVTEIFSQQMVISDTNVTIVSWQDVFPVFTIFKFLIYMGWFKTGLSLINPFGRETTDIPLDLILDYNLEISATIGTAEEFYFPENLSEDYGGTDKDRLNQLEDYRFLTSTTNKLPDSSKIDEGLPKYSALTKVSMDVEH